MEEDEQIVEKKVEGEIIEEDEQIVEKKVEDINMEQI